MALTEVGLIVSVAVFSCLACVTRNRDGGFPLKWVSYLDKKREVALNRRFNRMVVVTTYMRDELLNNGFDSNRIEIHAPVPRMGDPNLRSSFSDRNLIMYAGQIIRGKGVDVLLESLALLDTKFECVILGDGNHREYCEKLSRKLGLAVLHFSLPRLGGEKHRRGLSAEMGELFRKEAGDCTQPAFRPYGGGDHLHA